MHKAVVVRPDLDLHDFAAEVAAERQQFAPFVVPAGTGDSVRDDLDGGLGEIFLQLSEGLGLHVVVGRPLHAAAEALAGIRLDVRVAEASGRLDRLDERTVAERVRLEREPQVGGKRGKRSRERKTENKPFHFIDPFVSVPQNMRYTFEM